MHYVPLSPITLMVLRLVALLIIAVTIGSAQVIIVGTVADSTGAPVVGATVTLHRPDGHLVVGAISSRNGSFSLQVSEGTYLLRIRSLGYDTLVRPLQVRGNDTLRVGILRLGQSSLQARDVIVEEAAPRVEVKGDTLEYNASQFKTERNADADRLVAKLPGVEIERGQVRAQGQPVQQVLVDGKSFFGQDPLATLRALPAEIVERVQVYDQMSDQARFTGFDDGQRIKTINLVTRSDRRQGQFGKLYAGYGENSRYTVGANVNHWGGDQRLSVMGMSNNVNQQNFAIEDILGMVGGGGNPFMRMMGSAFSAMRQTMRGVRPGSDGPGFISNFLVTPTDGITQSHALVLNYSNEFGSWLDLSGSYFLNASTNDAVQSLERQLFLGDSATQRNLQRTDATTRNWNHRLNLRADVTLDSMNSILVTPRLSWQTTDRSAVSLITTSAQEQRLNQLNMRATTLGRGFTSNSELLYRRRFATEGRTLSARLQWSEQTTRTDPSTNSYNAYYDGAARFDSIVTTQPQDGSFRTLSANLLYTEPLAERHQFQLGYTITTNAARYDRDWIVQHGTTPLETYWLTTTAAVQHQPSIRYKLIVGSPDTSSTTQLLQGIMRGFAPRGMGRMMQQSGVGVWNIELGTDYQHTAFQVDQTSTLPFSVQRTFRNFLPTFSVTTRPTLMSFFRAWYSTRTNLPTPSQLQEALDNTNPLQLSIGNGRLDQEYTHSLGLTYGTFELSSASSFFIALNANLTQRRIATETVIATTDTALQLDGASGRAAIPLPLGTQLQRPVNLDGYWNATVFVLYSRPVTLFDALKLNVSGSLALTYLRDPSLINDAKNIAHTTILTPGVSITSNISENLDFTLSGRTAWNTVQNTIRRQFDQRFVTYTVLARATYITSDSSAWLDGWVFTAEFNYVATSGLAEGYNLGVPLLNIGIGKRFLDGRGELRLSVFDVLNRNNSINRNVGSGYVEDTQTNVLRRYALLSITYFLRAFKGS